MLHSNVCSFIVFSFQVRNKNNIELTFMILFKLGSNETINRTDKLNSYCHIPIEFLIRVWNAFSYYPCMWIYESDPNIDFFMNFNDILNILRFLFEFWGWNPVENQSENLFKHKNIQWIKLSAMISLSFTEDVFSNWISAFINYANMKDFDL